MNPPNLSRRAALIGSAYACVCARAAFGQGTPGRAGAPKVECADLTEAPTLTLNPVEQEAHTIFLLLSMALVHDGWGVDRQRPDLIDAYSKAEPGRHFPDYLGHNIGALMVDRKSNIVCFALNRSVQLNSSLEHAEARSVRNAIQIANAALRQTRVPSWSFGNLLEGDRLYTTLEPCSQCSGIMHLANIGGVIYAQDDPGQHHISNILYNLRRQPDAPGAPLPIRATFLPVWDELTGAYRQFVADAPPKSRTGLTSFLETVEAYRIFRSAAAMFRAIRVRFEGNAPILKNALAFRSRWQGHIQSGLVPM